MVKGVTRAFKGTCAALACALVLAPSAFAAPGDIYVADEDASFPVGNGGVFKLGPSGGAAAMFASHDDFGDPTGLALYPDGRLVVADSSNEFVFFVDLATGAVTNAGSSPLLPGLTRDVAVTADRKLLFVSEDNEKVVRYDPATGAFSSFADLPPNSQPRSVVATRDGGAYLGADPPDPDDPVLYRISPEGLATEFLSDSGLRDAVDLTLSPDERTLLVATRSGADDIKSVDLETKAITVRVTGDAPASAALLPDGSVVVSDYGAEAVFRAAPGATTGTLLSDDSQFNWLTDVLVEPERCAGLIPTIVGTTGHDTLRGSVFADVFLTLGGDDEVRGLAGDDIVCAGDGRDRVYGGPGADQLFGGAGKDLLRGKGGNDRLLGQAGKDRLVGGKGKDRLKGGPGKDFQKQ